MSCYFLRDFKTSQTHCIVSERMFHLQFPGEEAEQKGGKCYCRVTQFTGHGGGLESRIPSSQQSQLHRVSASLLQQSRTITPCLGHEVPKPSLFEHLPGK